MAIDINSPPYPKDGVSADGMYNHFQSLRDWILAYRDECNDLAGQQVVPVPIELPHKRAYLTQPVVTQWMHLRSLRRIREEWDQLVRYYETEKEWALKQCKAIRIMLVQAAVTLLNNAFTPYEVMEMRHERQMEQTRRMFDDMSRRLMEVLEPRRQSPEADDDDEEEEDDDAG